MFAVYRGMVCASCEDVVDVLVGEFGQEGPISDPELEAQRGRCPQCQSADVRPWTNLHPGPKCRRSMKRTEDFSLWD